MNQVTVTVNEVETTYFLMEEVTKEAAKALRPMLAQYDHTAFFPFVGPAAVSRDDFPAADELKAVGVNINDYAAIYEAHNG